MDQSATPSEAPVTPPASPSPAGKFLLSEVVRESRGLISGSKGSFLLMSIVVTALAAVAIFIVGMIVGTFSGPAPTAAAAEAEGSLAGAIATTLVGVLMAPLFAGFAAAGLQRVAGEDISVSILFEQFDKAPKLMALAAIPTLIVVMLTLVLGAVGAIISSLLIATLPFSIYYVLDRDASIIEAIQGSVQIVMGNLAQYVLYLLLTILLGIVGAVTFGIAHIWVMPFSYISMAVIYTHVVGVKNA